MWEVVGENMKGHYPEKTEHIRQILLASQTILNQHVRDHTAGKPVNENEHVRTKNDTNYAHIEVVVAFLSSTVLVF